jgi:hypothetical protein
MIQHNAEKNSINNKKIADQLYPISPCLLDIFFPVDEPERYGTAKEI